MKALLIDDSSTMRRIIQNALKNAGYTDFVEAEDGVDGLEKFKTEGSFDVILLDWNMPNMNGFDCLLEIIKIDKTAPVIMCTTEAEKTNVIQAIKAGAKNYITKPFTAEILKTKLPQ